MQEKCKFCGDYLTEENNCDCEAEGHCESCHDEAMKMIELLLS